MGSLLDELARREAAARQRIEEIREEIAGLEARLEAGEDRLSRLVIARETVEEILGEVSAVVEEAEVAGGRGVDGGMAAESSPVGVVTVPPWEPGMRLSVLPRAYRDAVEILLDGGGAMRAGKILEAMGVVDVASKREGLRSKLKRLEERGWLVQAEAGLFTVRQEVARDITDPAAGGAVAGRHQVVTGGVIVAGLFPGQVRRCEPNPNPPGRRACRWHHRTQVLPLTALRRPGVRSTVWSGSSLTRRPRRGHTITSRTSSPIKAVSCYGYSSRRIWTCSRSGRSRPSRTSAAPAAG